MALKPLRQLSIMRPLVPPPPPVSTLGEVDVELTPEEAARADHIKMMKGLREQQAEANEMANSTAYYRAIFFETADQAETFEKHFQIESGGMYWDGVELAEKLGVNLVKRTVKYKTSTIDKKCAALAR